MITKPQVVNVPFLFTRIPLLFWKKIAKWNKVIFQWYFCFLISISQEGRLYFCGVSKSLLGGLDFATFWYFLLSQKVAPQVHIFCFRRNWRLKLWELELKGYFVISINEALLLYLVKKITFVVCLSEQPLDNFCFRRKRLILI